VTTTLMWEAKAPPGRGAELLAWALEHADPNAEVYRSGDERVVVIDKTARSMPDAPPELLARTPHVWRFEQVRR
jgi:hypothetical protein